MIAITLLAILFCRKIHTTVRPLVRLSLTKEIVELELHKMKSLQLSMDLSGEDENRDYDMPSWRSSPLVHMLRLFRWALLRATGRGTVRRWRVVRLPAVLRSGVCEPA